MKHVTKFVAVQVWMSRYPDGNSKSGGGPDLLAAPATAFSWLPGGRPAVHRGFLNSWRANSLNQRVKQRIWEILYGEDMDRNNVKVLCTGGLYGSLICLFWLPVCVLIYRCFGLKHVGFARQSCWLHIWLCPDTVVVCMGMLAVA